VGLLVETVLNLHMNSEIFCHVIVYGFKLFICGVRGCSTYVFWSVRGEYISPYIVKCVSTLFL